MRRRVNITFSWSMLGLPVRQKELLFERLSSLVSKHGNTRVDVLLKVCRDMPVPKRNPSVRCSSEPCKRKGVSVAKHSRSERLDHSLLSLFLPLCRLIPLALLNRMLMLRRFTILPRQQMFCHILPELPALVRMLPVQRLHLFRNNV